jgi:outer membrane protein OmpA-like peptidoglycan-associated protein
MASAVRSEEPKAQYTVDELKRDFSKPPEETTGGVKMRGFSLAAPAAPAASEAPEKGGAATRPRTPQNARQVAHAGHGASASHSTNAGRDLLITFANASSTLTPQAKANAKVFAQAANSPELQSARFAIDGHTNAVGGRDYNLALSRSRAASLTDYLASQGVDRSRIDVNGYGFDRPINAANPRAPENRRVEARRLE